jgi:hypothetical protein
VSQHYDEDMVERLIDAAITGPVDLIVDLAKELASQRCWTAGVYEVSSAYGGPEEGGWYYETAHPVEEFKGLTRTYATEEQAVAGMAAIKEMVDLLNKQEKRKACRPSGGCGDDDDMMRGQSAGEGQYEVRIVAGPELVSMPERRPHYE